jgi:hypothetical protein
MDKNLATKKQRSEEKIKYGKQPGTCPEARRDRNVSPDNNMKLFIVINI